MIACITSISLDLLKPTLPNSRQSVKHYSTFILDFTRFFELATACNASDSVAGGCGYVIKYYFMRLNADLSIRIEQFDGQKALFLIRFC